MSDASPAPERRIRMPHTLVIVGSLIVFVLVLSWLVPSGAYQTMEKAGRQVTIPGTWFFVSRYRYGTWTYVVVIGFAQAIGDGGLFFFANAPAMLIFLPYPMTNYHAVNVLPFLAVRDGLSPGRPSGGRAWLAVPAVVGTYLVCGALIKVAGRWWGLAPQ